MVSEEKFGKVKDNLIEGFLARIKNAENVYRLATGIFSMCAAMGLTFDKERTEFINGTFLNVYPTNQTFNEFKTGVITSLQDYLRTQIK